MIIIIIILLLVSVSADSADLLDLYHDALENDTQFYAAQTVHRIGIEQREQSRANFLPKISFNAQQTLAKTHYESLNKDLSQSKRAGGYSVQLLQPVFHRGDWFKFNKADFNIALGSIRVEKARQSLMYRCVQVYFDILSARQAVFFRRKLQLAAAKQLDFARKNFELGVATIVDVHETNAEFDRLSAALISAESELSFALYGHVRLTGKQTDSFLMLPDYVDVTPPWPDQLDRWLVGAEQYNLEVKESELLMNIASQDVRQRYADRLPTVDLVMDYGVQNLPALGTGRTVDSSVELRFTLPLYSGGRIGSLARESQLMHSKTEADLEGARRSAVLTIKESWLEVTSGLAKIRALKAAKISSLSALESNQQGYKIGARINLDVLNAQSQYANVQQQLARARYDTLLAKLRLKMAATGLVENDLKEINAQLVNGELDWELK